MDDRDTRGEASPLSPQQRGLWRGIKESSSPLHHVTARLRLRGSLDRLALRAALNRIVAQHEILRATLLDKDGQPEQVIVPDCRFALTEQHVDAAGDLEQICLVEAHEPFDLSRGPLSRGRLLQLSDRDHVLVLTQHRLISDDLSMQLLIRELSALYRAFALGVNDTCSSAEPEKSESVKWCTGSGSERRDAEQGVPISEQSEQTRLHADRQPSGWQPCTDQWTRISLPTALTERLRTLARQRRVSMLTMLLSSWAVLVGRWSGQQEVVIGTRIANRGRPEIDRSIGPRCATVALRIVVNEDATLEQLLDDVEQMLREANAHCASSRASVGGGSPGPLPIVMQLDELPSAILRPADLQLPRLRICDVSIGNVVSGCELSLSLSDTGGSLNGRLEYASSLFDAGTIRRVLTSWQVLLKGAVKHPKRSIGRLPLLAGAERKRVLYEFNDTAAAFPRGKLIHEIFEEQVQRSPQAVAVVCRGESLTYSELNRRANQLARYLEQVGTRPGECVPVFMSRSLEMLVAQLAVLKSGAVYVPMDPALPAQRQMFMIKDCAAQRLLADRPRCVDGVDSVHWITCLEVTGTTADLSVRNLDRRVATPAPAYVMYTSGSTGIPKGVVVPHHAVNKLVINAGYVTIEATDCIAHCSNPAFDASTFEIWAALLNGARVLIVPQADVLDAERLRDVLRKGRVTALWLTVGLFTHYATALADVFRGLRYLITGGDVVDPGVVQRVIRGGAPLHLLNAYGPTECTTFSTIYEIAQAVQTGRSLPIGRPIANTQIYILDSYLQPVPIGVTGEICIGGAGVAGYLHRPELSDAKFVADPFGADPAARLYRSGDRGRWRADGNIEFLGRNDQQLKIRGFRIEPGEVEARLLQHSQVNEAIVIAREDAPGSKYLVAYVTPARDHEPSVEQLRAHLHAALPDYMIPSAIVILERLPLTENGKVDRRALPSPELGAYASRPYEPPHNDLETALAALWQDVLHVERVGRQDNFFELGGHSLLVARLLERLRAAGLMTHARSVYESQTLADLALTLTNSVALDRASPNLIANGCLVITPQMLPLVDLEPEHIERIVGTVPGGAQNIQDIYPLAPLQEGILFHHLLTNHAGDAYVFSMLFSLSCGERLQRFIAAVQQVIDRHDILRTAIIWEQMPRPVQVVYRRATLVVEDLALAENRDFLEQLEQRMQPGLHRLDLRQAPLIRLQVVRAPQGEQWYALLWLHHLLCDQESLEAMLQEIAACIDGKGHELPAPVPYRDHVAHALLQSATHESAEFFRSRLGDVTEPTAPFGLLDVQGGSGAIDECRQSLQPELASRIRDQARRLCTGAATLFHAAWAVVVAHTSGRDDVVFGTVLSGRLQSAAGAQRIVGMLINTLPMRLNLADLSADELIDKTRRELVELLANEQTPLALAQHASCIAAPLPLFTSLLNYQQSSIRFETQETEIGPGVRSLGLRSRTNYPVALIVDDQGDGFVLRTKTEQPVDPVRLTGYVVTALESLVESLERGARAPALSLAILPAGERRQILELFNATARPYPSDALLHELFEEQVARTPRAVAVEHDGRSLTYQELNHRANQLARHLQAYGAAPDQRVALYLHRSVEMLVALLGVLKAGAAYVPLDPNNPVNRLQHILGDAQPLAILTHAELRSTLPESAAKIVSLDRDWEAIAQQPGDNLDLRPSGLKPHHLAYVIYTSGSTGAPKGVMVEHRNIVNYAVHALRQFDVAAGNGSLVCTSTSFDLMLTGLYPTWLCGRTVRLCPEQQGLPALVPAVVACRDLAPLKLTPSHLALLDPALVDGQLVGHIRVLVAGGEPLPSGTVERWRRHAPGTRVFNHYGPTEATVGCIAGEPTDLASSTVPLGRPISNTEIYILDCRLQPVPIGVAGEIHIAGAGVTRGYLNRPELSAERFIHNPFSTDPHARMYRTGDLGRWRADGTVEYLGRNDEQVKVRGFRIEPGEIESHLREHEQVRDAAVVARDDMPGGKRLVAYVTLGGSADVQGEPASGASLRTYLQARLPEFLVPSAIVVVPQLPLTANGKLDRRALPAPPLAAGGHGSHEAPRGEMEEIVAAIWQELLRVERIDRRDHFFELGGHSLLAMQVVVRLQSLLPIRLPMRALFEHPTLEQLAARVQELDHARLHDDAAEEGTDMEDLLREVATMPESEVQTLMRKLTGVRP